MTSAISVLAAILAADVSPRPAGFNPRTAAVSAEAGAHRGRVGAIAFTPDGRGLFSIGGTDFALKAWSGRLRETTSVERQFSGDRLAVSPDGSIVAAIGMNRQLVIYDLKRREVKATIANVWTLSKCFALSPDGKSVAAMIADGTARVFSTADGSERAQIAGARNTAGALAWSRNGRLIATVGLQRTGKIVDAATGEEVAALEGTLLQARDLQFSPDDGFVAVSDVQGQVRLYDAKTGREHLTLGDRAGGMKQIAFSRDGRLLVTGDATGVLRVYELKTGREVRRIDGAHAGAVSAIAFSPDGRTLATGGNDGKIKLWGGMRAPAPAPPERSGKPGYLGITGTWNDDENGVVIDSVVDGSAAARAGLRTGDILTAFDGKAFESFEGLRALVVDKKEGDEVELKIKRGGAEQKLKARLGAKPE
jgi:WD40 repeat protein